MTKFSTSLIINRNHEAIWEILSDVVHWHEWTPTITKVEALNTAKLNPGNRYKVVQPKLQPAEWTVTKLSTTSFIWESRSPGMYMVADHILKPINAKQTELTLTFVFDGWLGRIVSKLYGKVTKEYIQTEAQSLKKKMESD